MQLQISPFDVKYVAIQNVDVISSKAIYIPKYTRG